MSYTPWVSIGSPQVIPRKVWTPLEFTDATEGIDKATAMPVTDGHTIFTLQVYCNLPAPVSIPGWAPGQAPMKFPGVRPTYIKTRFRRVFLDGFPEDPSAYDTIAIPIEVESWHHTHTMFMATDPGFTISADLYHNGKDPITLGTRILKGWNPLDDIRITLTGRINPADDLPDLTP